MLLDCEFHGVKPRPDALPAVQARLEVKEVARAHLWQRQLVRLQLIDVVDGLELPFNFFLLLFVLASCPLALWVHRLGEQVAHLDHFLFVFDNLDLFLLLDDFPRSFV